MNENTILINSLKRLYASEQITLETLQGIYDKGRVNITKEVFHDISGEYPTETPKPISDLATEEDYKQALTELGVDVSE